MRAVIFAFFVVASPPIVAQEYPDIPTEAEILDPELELKSLGSFNGVWEGFFEVNYDPVGFYRDSKAGAKMRFVINGSNVQVQVYEDGNPVRLAVENFIYAVEGTALINTVNRNHGFVQSFSIFLAHVARDRMEGYVSLNVHDAVSLASLVPKSISVETVVATFFSLISTVISEPSPMSPATSPGS